jgi:tRNA (cytidine56-2'-O)-methyltransferase
MSFSKSIWVLRIGHRLVRDDRVTTHVALVARAFGSNGIYLCNAEDEIKKKVDDVTKRWGGDFKVKIIEGEDWRKVIKGWKKKGGLVVHLTMYGLNVDDVIDNIRREGKEILVVVGAEKVPSELFKISDYNVAISNQPHSEVAALAIFLDRLFKGKELRKEFKNWEFKIIPSDKGKLVIKASD